MILLYISINSRFKKIHNSFIWTLFSLCSLTLKTENINNDDPFNLIKNSFVMQMETVPCDHTFFLSFHVYYQIFIWKKKIKFTCTCVNPGFMMPTSMSYVIMKACWAPCSSGMKRSPITLSSKNMGSVAEQRIRSILWSNPRQCSSNKAESNGKIKVLNVWTFQHYSSGPLNGVLSRHDNSIERVIAMATGHLELE